MKFPTILESWRYRDPEEIGDGLIARTNRINRVENKEKPKSPRKDRYYSQSRSIHIRELVRIAKSGGLRNVP